MTDNLQERLPKLIKMVRQVKTAVAQTSVECRPNNNPLERDRWYKPFEEIQEELNHLENLIRFKLREHK